MMNNKGMTLIEEIIALAIISMASLIMLVGFSTAANIFADSTMYKDITNKQYSVLLGNETSDDSISVLNENTNISIKVNDKTILVRGKQNKVTSNNGTEAVLSNIVFDNLTLSNTLQTLANCNNFLEEVIPITKQGKLKEWFANVCNEQGVNIPDIGYYFSNDIYRCYYYYYFGLTHLRLEQEIIDKCNEIFNIQHPSPSKKELEAYIGDSTLYIRPYFCGGLKDNSDNFMDYCILVATPSNLYSERDGWNTRLIYNTVDSHWYYKIFPAGNSNNGSTIGIAGFTNTAVTIRNLANGTIPEGVITTNSERYNLSDQTQWVRID